MRRTVQILTIRNIQFLHFALLSSAILIRYDLKPFKEIFVCGISFEFYSRSIRYWLIVILLIVWSLLVLLKLVLIAWGAIERYFRNFMLWIRTLLQLYWGWGLELLLVSRMVLEFSWGFEAVIWYFISPINECILFRVVIWLERKRLIVLSIRRIAIKRDVSFYYWSLN